MPAFVLSVAAWGHCFSVTGHAGTQSWPFLWSSTVMPSCPVFLGASSFLGLASQSQHYVSSKPSGSCRWNLQFALNTLTSPVSLGFLGSSTAMTPSHYLWVLELQDGCPPTLLPSALPLGKKCRPATSETLAVRTFGSHTIHSHRTLRGAGVGRGAVSSHLESSQSSTLTAALSRGFRV